MELHWAFLFSLVDVLGVDCSALPDSEKRRIEAEYSRYGISLQDRPYLYTLLWVVAMVHDFLSNRLESIDVPDYDKEQARYGYELLDRAIRELTAELVQFLPESILHGRLQVELVEDKEDTPDETDAFAWAELVPNLTELERAFQSLVLSRMSPRRQERWVRQTIETDVDQPSTLIATFTMLLIAVQLDIRVNRLARRDARDGDQAILRMAIAAFVRPIVGRVPLQVRAQHGF